MTDDKLEEINGKLIDEKEIDYNKRAILQRNTPK